jgi:hypothetical protein
MVQLGISLGDPSLMQSQPVSTGGGGTFLDATYWVSHPPSLGTATSSVIPLQHWSSELCTWQSMHWEPNMEYNTHQCAN